MRLNLSLPLSEVNYVTLTFMIENVYIYSPKGIGLNPHLAFALVAC